MKIQESLDEYLAKMLIVNSHSRVEKRPEVDIDNSWGRYDELKVPEFVEEELKHSPVALEARLLVLVMTVLRGIPGAMPGVKVVEMPFESSYGDCRSRWFTYYDEGENTVFVNLNTPEWYAVPATLMELMLHANATPRVPQYESVGYVTVREIPTRLEYRQVGYFILSVVPESKRLVFASSKVLEGKFWRDNRRRSGKKLKIEALDEETTLWQEIEQKLLEQS